MLDRLEFVFLYGVFLVCSCFTLWFYWVLFGSVQFNLVASCSGLAQYFPALQNHQFQMPLTSTHDLVL